MWIFQNSNYKLLVLFIYGVFYRCQAEYVGVNCDFPTIGEGSCSDRISPSVDTIDDQGTYPSEGFCIVHDDNIIRETKPYLASVPLCFEYGFVGSFTGGMFFNLQDDDNYDFFFLTGESRQYCRAGHVLNGDVYETLEFICKSDDSYYGWMKFEVWAERSFAILRLKTAEEETEVPHYPYFPVTTNAGPLHVNGPNVHAHLHFDNFNISDPPLIPSPPYVTTPEQANTMISDTTPVDWVTDVPSDVETPQYQIRLQGDFRSSTGGDFSSSCAQSYVFKMDEKVQQMKFTINNIIGNSICSTLTTELINVITASPQMTFNGNTGEAWPSFYLELAADVYLTEVQDCVYDITQFLLPHSNWGQYVVEPVPGCPEVDFTSNYFNDENDFWICSNSLQENRLTNVTVTTRLIEDNITMQAFEPPLFAMGHIGYFSTADGSDLSTECQSAYSASLYDTTTLMVDGINNPDDGSANHICGADGYVLSTSTISVSAFGNEGISVQDYTLKVTADVQFSDVHACADKILSYLAPHSNWIADPIIPPIPPCPLLIFSPSVFEERFQQWICVTANKNEDKEQGTGFSTAVDEEKHENDPKVLIMGELDDKKAADSKEGKEFSANEDGKSKAVQKLLEVLVPKV